MLRAYLDAVRAWAGAARLEAAPAAAAFVEVVLAAHGRAGERLDVALLERLPEAARAPASPPAPPAELARPELLGQVYEALLEPTGRRRRGAYFTPPAAAAGLVRAALACWTPPADGAASPAPAVCDLTCGGGVFLLAAAEALAASATSPLDAAARVRGVDVDPGACEVAAASLALWARLRGASLPGASRAGAAAVRCADAFTLHGAQFDLVVGNPPFLNQLQRGTARAPEQAAVLARRFGGAARGYVDSSALFLLAALDLVRAGGVVALVQPESLLAAAHAEGVRAALLERAGLHGLWLAGEAVFDAAVRVCAPVLVLAGGAAPPAAGLLRWTGCEVTPAPPLALDAHALAGAPSWSPAAAGLGGAPPSRAGGPFERSPRGLVATLGEACAATATAGFRDQYYGIEPYVVDAAGGDGRSTPAPPEPGDDGRAALVPSGLLTPARCWWGVAPVRFAKRRWQAPCIDLPALRAGAPTVAAWFDARLTAKVLVGVQQRVLTAYVDEAGRLAPSVPVITVTAPTERLWAFAAALCAPSLTAHALAQYRGAALSADAIKLSAKQLVALPAPVHEAPWREAEAALRAAASAPDPAAWRRRLADCAEAADRAYGVDDPDLLEWWKSRLPRWKALDHVDRVT